MTSYDINIHSQHYPASSHSPETFSWLEYSSHFFPLRRNVHVSAPYNATLILFPEGLRIRELPCIGTAPLKPQPAAGVDPMSYESSISCCKRHAEMYVKATDTAEMCSRLPGNGSFAAFKARPPKGLVTTRGPPPRPINHALARPLDRIPFLLCNLLQFTSTSGQGCSEW
ncbi:hypothetical protein ANN_10347 [Periplaneta americana]|uniref:Uncharacterized protein n=1 Tax=Periplaneta americana TaxID=6978 RepID=A0ABQ8TP09_PERAM|nr:hypothetical protein ANN_10347 [Periplaneta americana]